MHALAVAKASARQKGGKKKSQATSKDKLAR
jgi:hypothetical protein